MTTPATVYATIADVARAMPQVNLTATSKPSIEQAQQYLDDIGAEVRAAIWSMGYIEPITEPDDVAQLRLLIVDGTVARVLYARSAGIGGEGATASADRAQKLYDARMKSLTTPGLKLLSSSRVLTDFVEQPQQSLVGDALGLFLEPRATMGQVF